jgi:hypothetical protein
MSVFVRQFCVPLVFVCSVPCITFTPARGEQPAANSQAASGAEPSNVNRQAKLEAALSQMLSGATLEGSFTRTSAGSDPTQLAREKYTLGEVKKIGGDAWQFPTRIQYGDKDVALPITLPIRWAGDTPVVVVDRLELPGFGSVSARVMFFEGHYAGYWTHGDHGGHLFGVIHSAPKQAAAGASRSDDESTPASRTGRTDPTGDEKKNK